jgi:hypothetical protein
MKAFHGIEEIKQKYVERMKAHIAADELIRGIGWKDGKGCAIGCTIHAYRHPGYEILLGLPVWLAHLEDRLFEAVSEEYSRTFPLRFLEVIPVGVDVDRIKHKFLHFVVSDAKQFARAEFTYVHKTIDRVLELLLLSSVSNEDLKAAASAARAAYHAADIAGWAAHAAGCAATYTADWAAACAGCAATYAAYAASAASSDWAADDYNAADTAQQYAASKACAHVVRAACAAAYAARAVAAERYADHLLTLLSSLKEEV